MAFEFLQAFARFSVDRSAYDRELAKMELDATRASRRIESALSATPALGSDISVDEIRTRDRALQDATHHTDDATKAHREHSVAAVQVARSLREVSRGIASEISPALGGMVGGVQAGAQAWRHFGLGVGVAVGAMAIGSEIIGVFVQRLKEQREAQVQLNMAKLANDFGAVEGQVKSAIQELDRFAEREKVIEIGKRGGARAFTAGQFAEIERLFSPGQDELQQRAAKSAQAASETFARLEVPRRTIETQLELLKVERESARQELERAGTVDELSTAMAHQLSILERTAGLESEKVRAAGRDEGQRLVTEGVKTGNLELIKQGKFIAQQAIERGKAVTDSAKIASAEVVQINRRQTAEVEALAIDAQQRDAERVKARTALARDVSGQILEIEASGVDARAQVEGHINDQIGGFFQRRRDLVRQTVDEEINGINRVEELQRQALQKRIGGAQGEERVKLERELTDLTAKAEDDRLRVREQAAVKTAQLAQQETEAQRRELDRRRQLAQEYFDTLKAAGVANLSDEINRQVNLVKASQAGTKDRLDAERKLIDQITAMRQAQQQAAAGIFGLVQKRLEEQGKSEFSLEDVTSTLADIRSGARENALSFLTGGRINREQLGEIQGVTTLNAQLGASGLTPTGAVTGAIGQIFTAGKPMDLSFADLQEGTTDLTSRFKELERAAVSLAARLMGATAASRLDTELGRNLQLANRRAPEAVASEGSS